jgi:hypothetical protein
MHEAMFRPNPKGISVVRLLGRVENTLSTTPRNKVSVLLRSSFRRRPESRLFESLWTPAFAGVSAPGLMITFLRGRVLRIQHVDVLDGASLLDIKPYVPRFGDTSEQESGFVGLAISIDQDMPDAPGDINLHPPGGKGRRAHRP